MPTYRVTFPDPVRYLPDHYKGRDVTELIVNAPSSTAALQHAIRVTVGDCGNAQIVELHEPLRTDPPIEHPTDDPQVFP